MPVPSSNIQLANDVYAEANGGYSSGQVELFNLGYQSYFVGPNGTNSISYNAWGRGVNSGNDRIYGTTATTTDINLNGFAGLTYFYDNTTFQVTLLVTNNLVNSNPPPPNPPIDNAVAVNIELWGHGFSYQYLSGGGTAQAQGTYGPDAVSQTNDPIIFRGYWKVFIGGAHPTFAGGNADLSINGTSKFTAQAVAAGSGGTTFDSAGFSTGDVASYGGFTGLYFEVTVN